MEGALKTNIFNRVLQRLIELKKYTGHHDYLFLSTRTYKLLSEATIWQALRTPFSDYHIFPHGCRHFFNTQANEIGLFRKEAIDAF